MQIRFFVDLYERLIEKKPNSMNNFRNLFKHYFFHKGCSNLNYFSHINKSMLTTLNCLIIDDDPLAIATLQHWLSKEHIVSNCLHCSTLEEAQKISSEYLLDIFIIDPDVFQIEKLKHLYLCIDSYKIVLMSSIDLYKGFVGSSNVYSFWPKPLYHEFISKTFYEIIKNSVR